MIDQDIQEIFELGIKAEKAKNWGEAAQHYSTILSVSPRHAGALYNLGCLGFKIGKLDQALILFKRAIEEVPLNEEVWIKFIETLIQLNKVDAAQTAIERAPFNSLSIEYFKKFQEILGHKIAHEEAQPHDPVDSLIASYNDGLWPEVIEQAHSLIRQLPDDFRLWNILGAAKLKIGQVEEACSAFIKVTELNQNYPDGFNNLGLALKRLGNFEDAKRAFTNAINLNPSFAEAYCNIGVALQEKAELQGALDAFNRAIKLKPYYADAHYNKAYTLNKQNKPTEAITAINILLQIKPDMSIAHVMKRYIQAHICDWASFEQDCLFINELDTSKAIINPFEVLALADTPDKQFLLAVNYAKNNFPVKLNVPQENWSKRSKRVRIGYFSANFYDFPGMHLMAGMLEKHDRSKFEIYAFSYGPQKNDQMRKRIVNAVDKFIEIEHMSHLSIKEIVINNKIDIAVHRDGYSPNSRTELFSDRLAPIQISYLGYPGTLGTSFIDYLIADPIVIPENKRQYFSEKIIYLPHTYQPNDNRRVISDMAMTRNDMGLPEKAFVFCCFNHNYKVSPREFDIWTCLLKKVRGSVLWLLQPNQWAEKNLKKEAAIRGIKPSRLIFAEKVPHSQHLARLKLADLCVDTFNYNSHTTASDALWAGLPIVTKIGESFAARVAASLLRAIDLPELITESEESYEALIFELATNNEKLSELKQKLASNRLSKPLFDTEKYTKFLEDGYLQAYNRHLNGKAANMICIQAD